MYQKDPPNPSGNEDSRHWVERYMRSGLAVIPVPAGEKNPNRPGWQNERLTTEDVSRCWTNGQGIGVLWGEPSGGLVDVDLDWPEAYSAAKHILPETRAFGRPSAPESHRVYRVAGALPKTKRYKVGGNGDDRSVVEVLSTGTQSLVPPSLHNSGERRVWYGERSATEMDPDALLEGVADAATAALIARNWPGRGARKDYVMAAAGYVGRHLTRGRAERVMEAAIATSGDEEADSRLRDVRDTLDNLEGGHAVTGGPTLDTIAPGVVDQLRRWHGWGSERQVSGEAPKQHAEQGKGLTVELAEAILTATPFAQNAGGRLLYYEGGVYRYGGEKFIAARVKAILGARGMLEKWSSYRAGEVAKYIAADAPELWERPPLGRVCVLNGIIDLKARRLLPHSRDWLSTVQIPVTYDPEATCPAWEEQVAQTFPEDAQDLAWEIVADLIQPDRSEQVALILVGEGGNGKSAFLENVGAFIGRSNRVALSLHRIEVDRFAASRLVGRLANICPDLPSTDLASTSMFKAITGGDDITGEYKYGDSFDFRPFCRLVFSANHLPRSQDASYAFFRRWRVVPFDRTFDGAAVIPRRVLDAKLQDPGEQSGLLNKALDALERLHRDGFTESVSMQKAWEEFRQTTDPLAVWLDRRTIEGPEAWVAKDELLNAYNLEGAKDGRPNLTKKAMTQALKRLRPNVEEKQKQVGGQSRRVWAGIGLRNDDPEDDGGGGGGGNEPDTPAGEVNEVNRFHNIPPIVTKKQDEVETGGEAFTNNSRQKPVKPVNPVEQDVTPRERPRPLTPEEAERVQRLVAQGMSPKWARVEVLGEGEDSA